MSQSLIIRKSSGTSLTIIRTGANSGGTAYVLPPANATTLGGVMVGAGITVAANGSISCTYAGLSDKPDLTVYLTTAAANATYQPKGNYLTAANLTFSNLTGKPTTLSGYGITDAYPLSTNPAGYLVPSNLTGYLTTASAASTYATITSLSSYLTTSTATSTYATISSLSSYLTSSTAASTYAILTRSIATGTGLTGGGDLSANRTLSLATSGVTAGTYGSQSASAAITVDTYGRITSASSNPIIIDWNNVSGRPDTATLVTLTGTQTLTNKTLGSTIVSGTLAFNGQLATQVKLQSPSETFTSPTIATGTLALDLATGTLFNVSLNAAISTIAISNTPASAYFAFALEFTADGTARAIAWPASFVWLSGSAPVVPSANGAKLVLVLYTTDGGTTWQAAKAGA